MSYPIKNFVKWIRAFFGERCNVVRIQLELFYFIAELYGIDCLRIVSFQLSKFADARSNCLFSKVAVANPL